MTDFDLLAPLSEPRRICSAPGGRGWLSTREAQRDLGHVLRFLDGEHSSDTSPPNTPLLVVASDRYHMLLACLAAWCRGRAVVLPPNHQVGTLEHVRALSGASLVLTDAELADCLAADAAPEDDACEPTRTGRVRGDQHLLTVFTSGTTGDHQACTKTAGQLLGEALTLGQALSFDASHTLAATVPCHHLYGLLFGVLTPFLCGAAVVRELGSQPDEIRLDCERWQVTDLVTVPAHLAALVEAGRARPFRLGRAFSSGTVLDLELAAQFREISAAQVIDVLGSTESGGIAWRVAEPGAVYVPLPGVEIAAAPDGRLLLRSPFLPPDSGWERMHDRVRIVEGGFEHLGRSDGVVKLGGKRIAVQELEARARQLDGITDAAVLVGPSTQLRGTELWLAVATRSGLWTRAALREALGRYFDPVVLPRRYRIVPRLPRDGLGKLQRDQLQRLFAPESRDSGRPGKFTVSESPSEIRLSTHWCVPEHSPFFQGHFPNEPVFPGVAQLSEFVLPAIASTWAELHRLEQIPVLKYKRPIKPGARLALEVRRPRGSASVHFEIIHSGEVCTAGQLCFAVAGAQDSTVSPS